MNWYSNIKFAQVWVVNWEDDDLESMLRALYELEYKYSMAKNSKFTGHPKRQENILLHLKDGFLSVATVVKNILVNTFKKWLNFHALTNPQQWASARLRGKDDRMEYYEDTEINVNEHFESLLYDYAQQKNIRVSSVPQYGINIEQFFRNILRQEIAPRINDFPEMEKMSEWYLEDYKETLQSDLAEEGHEEFGERMGQNFTNASAAQNWIDNIGTDYIDITDYIDSLESFVQSAVQVGNWKEVLEELYAKLVFPAWYNIWY